MAERFRTIAKGDRHGRLTAISQAGRTKAGGVVWLFRCDCGTETAISASRVRDKDEPTRSCGCLKREHDAKLRLHGLTDTPEHKAWMGMRARCYNPNHQSYKNYGGRGITVCDRWRDSFHSFLEDMGPRPADHLSLDRRDNDRGYEPGNCRWATDLQQNRNRRNVKRQFDIS